MNYLFSKKRMKNAISLLCALLLVFGLISPSLASAVSAETNKISIKDKNQPGSEFNEKENIILAQKLSNIEDEIDDYLDTIPYTEDEFEAMSNEEFDKVFNTYFNSEEFLELEREHGEVYSALEGQHGEIQPMIAPILVPILANVARIALQTVVKHGTRVASSYLKKHLKKVGKNYKLTWNIKNSQKKVTTLLRIQHKPTKQIVFRLDNGSLHAHLKPGTSQWFWHFHIGGTPAAMKHHYSLRAIIPSKYKPKSSLTLY